MSTSTRRYLVRRLWLKTDNSLVVLCQPAAAIPDHHAKHVTQVQAVKEARAIKRVEKLDCLISVERKNGKLEALPS